MLKEDVGPLVYGFDWAPIVQKVHKRWGHINKSSKVATLLLRGASYHKVCP